MNNAYGKKTAYITVILIGLNILNFLYLEFLGSTEQTQFMVRHGAMYAPLILEQGEYYRLLTSTFLHFGINHLANNMLTLFLIGERLEPVLGRLKYLILYLFCGIGANVISMMLDTAGYDRTVGAGASGAVFGIVGSLFVVIVKNHGRLEDLSISRMAVMIFFSVYLGFSSSGVNNTAHVAGLMLGMLLTLLIYKRPKALSKPFS